MDEAHSKLDDFYAAVLAEHLASSVGNLKFRLDNLFAGIEFQGARFLDIGGGAGIYSLYALARGAAHAVCNEPALEGSTSGILQKFESLHRRLPWARVELVTETFQDFEPETPFDIILLYNTINHLDEPACIDLLVSPQARETYHQLLDKLYHMASPGAYLLVCDCSRDNFFPTVGLKNPIAKSIEWEKHQAPEVWSDLLAKVGFRHVHTRWTSFNPLRTPGKLLLGNRLASYFLTSHFCLRMQKPA